MRPPRHRPLAARAVAWLAWWVVLMALWTWVDDSLLAAELAVGAAAAAIAATLVELAQHQANARVHIRAESLARLADLPRQVVRDFVIVMGALFDRLVRRREPASGFLEVPVEAPRGNDAQAETKRAVIIGTTSVAPNTFVLGLDADEGVMVVHRLVMPRGEGGPPRGRRSRGRRSTG